MDCGPCVASSQYPCQGTWPQEMPVEFQQQPANGIGKGWKGEALGWSRVTIIAVMFVMMQLFVLKSGATGTTCHISKFPMEIGWFFIGCAYVGHTQIQELCLSHESSLNCSHSFQWNARSKKLKVQKNLKLIPLQHDSTRPQKSNYISGTKIQDRNSSSSTILKSALVVLAENVFNWERLDLAWIFAILGVTSGFLWMLLISVLVFQWI